MTKNLGARLKQAEENILPEVQYETASAEEMEKWLREVLAAPAPVSRPALITAHGRPLTVTEYWLNSLIKEFRQADKENRNHGGN